MPLLNTCNKEALVGQYTAADLVLFPLQSTGNTPKEPAIGKGEDWRHITLNPHLTHTDLPQAYACVIPPDVFVLDVDPRRFDPESDDQIARLWAELKLDRPTTLVVSTAGGGWHIYYKKPAHVRLKSNKQMESCGYGAIEVKRLGHYVVAAGSRIHDKMSQEWRTYSVERGSPLHIEEAPEVLLNFLQADAIESKDSGIESDSPGTRQRFVKYCMTAPPAINHAGGNATTLAVAHRGHDFGLPENSTFDIMERYYNHRCEPAWDIEKLKSIVANAYKYAQNAQGCDHPAADFQEAPQSVLDQLHKAARIDRYRWDEGRRADGTPKLESTIGNVHGMFMVDEIAGLPGEPNPLHGLVRFNVFAGDIEFTKQAPWHRRGEAPAYWQKQDTLQLKLFFNQVCHFIASSETINEGVEVVALKHRIHPVQDYLYSLNWDQKPRLDKWLVTYTGAEDTPYVCEVGKNTILASVARIFEPGCKHDSILVLEGEQGTGKSSVVEVLGGKWYLDPTLDLKNMRDTSVVLEGGWFVELAEMDFARKSDFITLRAFVTRKTDKVRPAYAPRHVYFPRQCVFIGTFNPEPYVGYLVDPTGNRRFWPVKTNAIDLKALAADRDQIFAEALVRYNLGEKHYIVSHELIEASKAEQRKRMQEEPFRDSIAAYLEREVHTNALSEFTTEAIGTHVLNCTGAALTLQLKSRVCRVLESLGYKYVTTKCLNGRKKRVWVDMAAFTRV